MFIFLQRQNEWFAHFYAPSSDNYSHAKHVVFVLDVSKSMEEKALEQLKMGMNSYLGKLRSKTDKFTIIDSAERAQVSTLFVFFFTILKNFVKNQKNVENFQIRFRIMKN